MVKLLECVNTNTETFERVLEKRKSQNKAPLLLTFLTPNTSFFDIFRLIKLSEFNQEKFEIIFVIENSKNKKQMKLFMSLIDKFIPNNKKIFLYDDILQEIFSNDEYQSLINQYNFDCLNQINKPFKVNNFSLSDINRFVTQYFILKNSKVLLGDEFDFFLTTYYKDLFFQTIPGLEESLLPTKLILKDVSINWNFQDSINVLERKLRDTNYSKKRIFSIRKVLLSSERIILQDLKNKDLFSIISLIQRFIHSSDSKKEFFATKSNFKRIISILNNKNRRKILSIISSKDSIKAEEIKKIVNSGSKKQYSLATIMKHLNILKDSELISKNARNYKINVKRIILEIPLSWLDFD